MSRSAKVRPPKNTIAVGPPETKFNIKEKIFVDYKGRGESYYEGSIISAFKKTDDGPIYYLVTYKGWGPK